jgi:hypothetical protein
MSRIPLVDPGDARGVRRLLYAIVKRQYRGFIPGVVRVLMHDLKLARLAGALYKHLHLRRRSPMTRLQREMLATVVNGKVGGAP